MKKIFVFIAFLSFVKISFSQVWVTSAPNISFNGGNVGIGNATPGVLCDIGSATKSAFAPTNAGILGLQVRQSFSNTTGSLGSLFYQAQTAATTGATLAVMPYTVTSNPTGTVAYANAVHSITEHSGAGTVT